MILDGASVMLDNATKFHRSLRISGWFHAPGETLARVVLRDSGLITSESEVGVEHGGVSAALGPARGFWVQALRHQDALDPDATLEWHTTDGRIRQARLEDLIAERRGMDRSHAMASAFLDWANADPDRKVLDIGGRARSRVDRSRMFRGTCTVLDVLAGDNVDVVGDAHGMAALLPHDHFDAVLSVSVFEHLLMPWAVVAQMNQVMTTGGQALIVTHQTLGLHDLPWDYLRFSADAWDGLFNARTGFEIMDRAMDGAMHVLPFMYRPDMADAEKAAGYEVSAVRVRKLGPCQMAWPMVPADVVGTMYPA